MKKHIWTSLALLLGVLMFAGGLGQIVNLQQSSLPFAGLFILLVALACRSANKRRLNEIQTSKSRFFFEFILVVIAILSIVLQNDLKFQIATDPVPNFIIPLICLIFYIRAFIKANNSPLKISDDN